MTLSDWFLVVWSAYALVIVLVVLRAQKNLAAAPGELVADDEVEDLLFRLLR